ncbi:MAG: tRNA (adenosine(37)-N6)-threonylcarbamoyltransferase complex dimerization subunit type 1 TsaB [Eubacteriales bacterium]|nr:tRNA (adenosine(37)-N6)-threonylcarbamoyltransferase complex dimerization subunit type 1 TsaB [Eubacteriales bacterium]
MKILALDSSGLVASAAVLENGAMLAEYTMNYKKTHSQTLLPMLDEISKMIDLDLNSLDAIAVAAGPGSFTGLRIGTATAKGLGLALDKPLAAVPTVDALAMNLFDARGLVVPMMDARRQQVYTGIYRFENHKLTAVHEQWASTIQELAEILNALGEEVILLGDGADAYRKQMEELLQVPFVFAPAHMSRQRAGAVGVLGMQYLEEGRTVSAADFKPEYLRKSQAEREQEEKGTSMEAVEERSEKLNPINHSEEELQGTAAEKAEAAAEGSAPEESE